MSATTKWTDLPHPFTATGPICLACGGYGRTVEPGGFAAVCESCGGSGEHVCWTCGGDRPCPDCDPKPQPVALDMAAD
jgi:hypothetical protein